MASSTRAAGWLRLSTRATSSRRGPLLALGMLALGFSLLLTGIAGYLSISATAQAVSELGAVPDAGRVFVLQAQLGDDPVAQREAAADEIRYTLDEAAVRVDVDEIVTGGQQYLRWTLSPHPTNFTAATIPGLITGIEALHRAFGANDAITRRGVTTDGNLATTLADIQGRIGAEQGASLVPLALVGLVALGQVSRLTAASGCRLAATTPTSPRCDATSR